MAKLMLIQKIAEQHPNNMTRKDVKGVIESLAEIGYKELKKTGAFFVPGFAKFVVIKKPLQRSGAASIRSQRSQQYLRRSPLGRSSGLGR
jgi:nucleoid DNA-binding protein